MSYPDENPRRRFERATHRAEDYLPPEFEPCRVRVSLPVPPRSNRTQLPPIDETDPRSPIRPGFEQRREMVVPRDVRDQVRDHVRDALSAGPGDRPVLRRRQERVLLAVEVTCWLSVVLLLLVIMLTLSSIVHALR